MSNSSTPTESDRIEPIHPGEILMEDFIDGFGITQSKLAVSISVPSRFWREGCCDHATGSCVIELPPREAREEADPRDSTAGRGAL